LRRAFTRMSKITEAHDLLSFFLVPDPPHPLVS
jgi:hypothetical protein